MLFRSAPDYTGYMHRCIYEHDGDKLSIHAACYVACEVKEASGNSMPASRLDKEQRAFMAKLPVGCSWVGIFWTETQKFTIHPFVEKGSYKQ